jgi:AcrR family transcriptional regulator
VFVQETSTVVDRLADLERIASMTTTPTTERGRRSRERIVDAASKLFYERGVTATGLAEVATASGTGKGQLYHYFDDKNDLVASVIQHQWTVTLTAQQEVLDELRTADDLRAWGREAIAAHEQGRPARCPLGSLVLEVAEGDDRLRLELQTAFNAWRDTLATGLERLQHSGDARRDKPPHELADVLLCAYEGGIVLSAARGHTGALQTALENAIEFTLHTCAKAGTGALAV